MFVFDILYGGVLDSVLMAVMVLAWGVTLIAALVALGVVLSMFT